MVMMTMGNHLVLARILLGTLHRRQITPGVVYLFVIYCLFKPAAYDRDALHRPNDRRRYPFVRIAGIIIIIIIIIALLFLHTAAYSCCPLKISAEVEAFAGS
jgi:hypothetical protein